MESNQLEKQSMRKFSQDTANDQADRQATTNDQATAKDGQDTTNVARQQVTVITKLLQSMFSAVGAWAKRQWVPAVASYRNGRAAVQV